MPQVPSSLLDPTLLQELCTTVLQPQVADFLPFGILARAKAYLALPDPPAEPQWQPIDTVPKDYRVDVLVYDASWCGGAPRITVTHWVGYQTRTGEVVEEKGAFLGVSKPTHWMPLPAPPRERAEASYFRAPADSHRQF